MILGRGGVAAAAENVRRRERGRASRVRSFFMAGFGGLGLRNEGRRCEGAAGGRTFRRRVFVVRAAGVCRGDKGVGANEKPAAGEKTAIEKD
jgi:hypothetical protein